MSKNKKESCTYYNVPSLNETESAPVTAVGIAVIKNANLSATLRFIIRRDRNVRISSFTLVYRFSGHSIKSRDTENPFYKYVYDKPDINEKDYILLRGNASEDKLKNGISAVISSITLENGEVLTYQSRDYEDPAYTVVSADTRTAERPLAAYFAARAMRQSTEGVSFSSRSHQKTEPIREMKIRQTSDVSAFEHQPKRRKKLSRSTIDALTAVFVVVCIATGIVLITTLRNLQISPQNSLLSRMIEEKRYSEAYQLVREEDNADALQELCEIAAAHYLTVRNYESAYLFASAAPEPFDADVIEKFTEYFLVQNRYEELYTFLKEQEQYNDALQTVCASAMEYYASKADYNLAMIYAQEAPESLESSVIEYAAEDLVQDNMVHEAALAVLEQLDADVCDTYLKQAVEALVNLSEYTAALELSSEIHSPELREKTVVSICIDGMKNCAANYCLSDAADLFTQCADRMDDTDKALCLDRLADHCFSNGDLAGTIFFRQLAGIDTSTTEIVAEEESIRLRANDVYFLLTADQKRAYHANPFALYKEAFLIEDGVLKGKGISNLISVSTFEYQTIVLRNNGTVAAVANDGHNKIISLPTDNDIVQIAAGLNHAVLLHDNGTVTVSGGNAYGQADTKDWKNIVKVAAGADFTVGLCADGTLVACGSNWSEQCNVEEYRNVMDIAACDQSTVLLFTDGSVKIVGDTSLGLRKVDTFTKIRRIRASAACVVAEKEDGSYVIAQGIANADCGSAWNWKNMKYFAAGSACIGAVDENGNIILEGDGTPVSATGNKANE